MTSVIICLPILNVQKYLMSVLENVIIISKLFEKIIIIFGYDHSIDLSLEIIQNFKKTQESENFHIEILINNNPMEKYRTHNLENIRNIMISCIYDKYSDYDYFIMMDTDDVCSKKINIEILRKHLLNNDKWDSLSFNRLDYYDIWALQYYPFIFHCRGFSQSNYYVIKYMKHDITNILKIKNTDDYFSVYSAFNGLAIYKLKKFINCKYDGKTQKYFSDDDIINMISVIKNGYKQLWQKNIKLSIATIKENCEHIGFHISAINQNNAKIMISPDYLFDN